MALGTAALVGAAPGVAADTPLSDWGRTGPHFLADTREYPGAACRYVTDATTLGRVKVRSPFLYARDATNDATDAQRVGWQVIVQERLGGGDWEPVARSSIQKARATDAQPAALRPIVVSVDGTGAAEYRVRVRMYWYRPGHPSTLVGRATHGVDWYRWVVAPSERGGCPGAIL
jgi:hypothetical protein